MRAADSAKFMNYTAAVFKNQDSKPLEHLCVGWNGVGGIVV